MQEKEQPVPYRVTDSLLIFNFSEYYEYICYRNISARSPSQQTAQGSPRQLYQDAPPIHDAGWLGADLLRTGESFSTGNEHLSPSELVARDVADRRP